MSELRRTPLFDRHHALGARMVDFAGWAMPVQFSSILDEHRCVREHAGLFDVSHMGQIHIQGAQALDALERLLCCPIASLRVGRVRYGLLCNENGGCVDDVTVYREAEDAFFLCVNAANIDKDRAWILDHVPSADVVVDDRSAQTGLLALQGPASQLILESVAPADSDLANLRRFTFRPCQLAGQRALVSRTGYTGSDGYEIYLPAAATAELFDQLLRAGAPHDRAPIGLGARDTLRLEAALPLYGHELDDTTSPLEAGLSRFVKRGSGGFIGATAIERREAAGRDRQLVGFEMLGRGIARAGHEIQRAGRALGQVTAGAPSPSLGHAIGLAHVEPAASEPGSRLGGMVRRRGVRAGGGRSVRIVSRGCGLQDST